MNTYNFRYENCDLSGAGTAALLQSIGASSGVKTVTAEAAVEAVPFVENDPSKRYQSHLDFINRDEACEIANRSGETVVVAVIDSGVDRDHADLRNSFYRDDSGRVVGANFCWFQDLRFLITKIGMMTKDTELT